MLPFFNTLLKTVEVSSSPLFLSLFHVGALLCNQTLTQSMESSLTSACFSTVIDYFGLFSPSCSLDLLPTCFLVGNVMTGTMTKCVI